MKTRAALAAIATTDCADLLAGRLRWTDACVEGRIGLAGDILLALKLRRHSVELVS